MASIEYSIDSGNQKRRPSILEHHKHPERATNCCAQGGILPLLRSRHSPSLSLIRAPSRSQNRPKVRQKIQPSRQQTHRNIPIDLFNKVLFSKIRISSAVPVKKMENLTKRNETTTTTTTTQKKKTVERRNDRKRIRREFSMTVSNQIQLETKQQICLNNHYTEMLPVIFRVKHHFLNNRLLNICHMEKKNGRRD